METKSCLPEFVGVNKTRWHEFKNDSFSGPATTASKESESGKFNLSF